ncbi:arylsulfatase, partial [Salmonella enterica subsp. enterica serovar Derby]
MKFKYALTSLALSVAILSSVPSTAFAIGGASGAKVDYQVQGKIGEVVMNPYDIAPLTAVIRNGGYQVSEGPVRIVPQKKRQENADKNKNKKLLKDGGSPLLCLYPDYVKNDVVEFNKDQGGKKQNKKE